MFVPTDSMNPEVDAFYKHKTYKQTVNIEHPNTYQEWSHLLTNRPWITYRSMQYITSAGTSVVVTSPPGTDGFIRGIPEHIIQQCQRDGNKICISGHWYELVESNEQQLFEVIPTFRNFIVCLNYLCNLHLYESEEDVFTHPTFNSTYFPELCKRLKPLQSLQLPKDLTMLDTHDYSADGIDFVGDKCTLIFKKNHSEYTAQETNKGLFDCAATIIKQTEHGDKKLIKLFPLFLTNSENICLKNMFPFVFGLDLHNHEEKIAALHHFFNEQHQFHNPDVKMIEFAAKLISALPIRLDWIYQIRVVHAIDPQLYDHTLIKPIIDHWKKIAYQRLAVETLEPDSPADFYTALAQHGHSLEEGINLARHINQNIVPTIKNPETKWLVEESALKLYHALAQQGLVKEEALSAAKNLRDAPASRGILTLSNANP